MKRGCLGQIRRDHSRCPVDSVRGRRSRANCGEATATVQVREDGASGQGVGAGGGESGRIGLYLEAFTFKSISLLGGTGKVPSPFSSVTHPMTPTALCVTLIIFLITRSIACYSETVSSLGTGALRLNVFHHNLIA